MAIPTNELGKMNEMLEHGKTIADIYREYDRKYDYWEIYGNVNSYSMLGAKRKITNRLDKLQSGLTKPERNQVVKQIKGRFSISLYIGKRQR